MNAGAGARRRPREPIDRLPKGDPQLQSGLFAAYPDGLIVTDSLGRIVLVNETALGLLGYELDELMGQSVEIVVPDRTRDRHAAYRAGYHANPRPRPMGTGAELVARRRDGTEVVVEIALSPMQQSGTDYVVAAMRSIADFPRVKLALKRARYSEYLARLGRMAADARDPMALLEHVPFIAAEALEAESSRVLLLEPDGQRLRVAAGIGSVPGQPIGNILNPDTDGAAAFVIANGQPLNVADFRSERRFQVPAGYLEAGLLSGIGVPLFDRGRTIGTLSVASRLADRFKDHDLEFLEALSNTLSTALQRARTEEALNHAQRLETVGQLTGGIAHDFNNLLTIIQGNLQVLEELPAVADDPYGRELITAAIRAARRGSELTGKLLAFSRRQVLRPTRVEVAPMLRSLAEMLARAVDQRIRITVEADETGLTVDVDPGQLESALLNLAVNARDAMPSGGQLKLHAFSCNSLPPTVRREPRRLAENVPGSWVAIAIRDTGEGMSEDVKEHALEPFFTTKAAGRGTGLGLSTVYGFINQSDGGLSLESQAGSGTTVTLYLPRRLSDGPARADDTPAVAVPPGLRVLLVEDDPEVRKVARRFLADLKARVTAVGTGEEARQLLDGRRSFDLLVTDIALGPGIRGTELAAEVKRRFPAMAVLLMSGFAPDLLDKDRDTPRAARTAVQAVRSTRPFAGRGTRPAPITVAAVISRRSRTDYPAPVAGLT